MPEDLNWERDGEGAWDRWLEAAKGREVDAIALFGKEFARWRGKNPKAVLTLGAASGDEIWRMAALLKRAKLEERAKREEAREELRGLRFWSLVADEAMKAAWEFMAGFGNPFMETRACVGVLSALSQTKIGVEVGGCALDAVPHLYRVAVAGDALHHLRECLKSEKAAPLASHVATMIVADMAKGVRGVAEVLAYWRGRTGAA